MLTSLVGAPVAVAEVTGKGQVVAAQAGHLADAVEAFADHGLSVVAAARALHVHPNTVIYRLGRWQTLTGWDPRTFRGLALSIASLRLT
jgi:DNA-binding PucR family transcriptional regulator